MEQQIINIEEFRGKDERIDARINELKENLKKIYDDHHYKIYLILKEILLLRQNQINGYNIKDIHKEKDLNMSDDRVRYYMGFDYITEETRKLIDSRHIKSSTVLFILRKAVEFKEPEMQRKIIDQFLLGNINTSELSHVPKEELVARVNSQTETPDSRTICFKIYYKLKELRKAVRYQKSILLDKYSNGKLLEEAQKLVDDIKNLEHDLKEVQHE